MKMSDADVCEETLEIVDGHDRVMIFCHRVAGHDGQHISTWKVDGYSVAVLWERHDD